MNVFVGFEQFKATLPEFRKHSKPQRKDFPMLLKKEKPAQIDPLENWPEHYYEIENAKERKEILAQAISRGLDLPNDNYRMKLLEKRYGKDGKSDAFMKAWMMIKASGAAGISFFNKRHLQKELKQYMKDLCLLEYAPENETEQAVLLTEWENFAKVLLASCTGSKTYCSTLFGIVPIKDASVARKIAEEIDFVTRTYPQKLELADEFAPFREVMVNTYCNMIENGSSYWYEVVNS